MDSLAAELVAFANSGGGLLIVGANHVGEVVRLTAANIGRPNPLLSYAASQWVRPLIHPLSLNVQTAWGLLMVIQAPDGLSQPYTDNRDYFISAPVRMAISNAGHLPNHLTFEQIRYGLSNMRNPLLASHATHLLPYLAWAAAFPAPSGRGRTSIWWMIAPAISSRRSFAGRLGVDVRRKLELSINKSQVY